MSPTPAAFKIVSLTRHRSDAGGRHYWVAEVTAEGVRIGADTFFGSWSCYEVTTGGPLATSHGRSGTARWEVPAVRGMTLLPFALQAEVHRLNAAETAPDPPHKRRRPRA